MTTKMRRFVYKHLNITQHGGNEYALSKVLRNK